MKTLKYTQRKRATARSRAAKREPLAKLKNPRPTEKTPIAPHIYQSPLADESKLTRTGFWWRIWQRLNS